MSECKESEWENIGKGRLIDDLYYELRHRPCGTAVYVATGFVAHCPKCEPEQFERLRKIVL
jgi:predicted metal-binding protein